MSFSRSKMAFYHDRKFFDTTDYVIFSITLLIPILIGIYYAIFSKNKPETVSEYLVGNRNMKLFPISMSIAASYNAGYALIGPITEVYLYGIQIALESIAMLISSFCFALLYLPVFYDLKITSTYEYLEMRFDSKVRLLGSFLFVIKTIFNMALWIYAPVLMFEQVVGVNLNVIIPIFSAICVFYTTFGGVRAVIWADTFQMVLMLIGMIVVIVVGVYDLEGFEKIWETSKQGGRLELFEAIVINFIVTATILFLSSYVGLLLYAAFHDCDPLSSKQISKPDQLLPYFVMNLKVPALPSAVISIVFCAALSSVSSALNSTSGVILIDFILPFSKRPITDAQGSFYMKIIVVVIGLLYTGLTYTLNSANSLVENTISLLSISLGSSLGIFTLGVLFPWANANGAFIGGIVGAAMIAWMSIGALTSQEIVHPTLPLSTDGHENSAINLVNQSSLQVVLGEPFFLYSISFFYYPLIGALTAITVGLIVSSITGLNKPKDPKLFSPVIQKYFKTDA